VLCGHLTIGGTALEELARGIGEELKPEFEVYDGNLSLVGGSNCTQPPSRKVDSSDRNGNNDESGGPDDGGDPPGDGKTGQPLDAAAQGSPAGVSAARVPWSRGFQRHVRSLAALLGMPLPGDPRDALRFVEALVEASGEEIAELRESQESLYTHAEVEEMSARVRERVRDLQTEVAGLRAQLAERRESADRADRGGGGGGGDPAEDHAADPGEPSATGALPEDVAALRARLEDTEAAIANLSRQRSEDEAEIERAEAEIARLAAELERVSAERDAPRPVRAGCDRAVQVGAGCAPDESLVTGESFSPARAAAPSPEPVPQQAEQQVVQQQQQQVKQPVVLNLTPGLSAADAIFGDIGKIAAAPAEVPAASPSSPAPSPPPSSTAPSPPPSSTAPAPPPSSTAPSPPPPSPRPSTQDPPDSAIVAKPAAAAPEPKPQSSVAAAAVVAPAPSPTLALAGPPRERTVSSVLRALVSPARPEGWMPDEHTECCVRCDASFTWNNRRHHCRACKLIFCAGCTEMMTKYVRIKASKTKMRPVRIRLCAGCRCGGAGDAD
jgi:hypothetical protein